MTFRTTSLFVVLLCCTAAFSQAPAGEVKVISSTEPVFPAEAANYIYGETVRVSLSVDKAGRVTDARVLGLMAPCKNLNGDATVAAVLKAATQAARSIVFEPMLKEGQPSEFGVSLTYSLRPDADAKTPDDAAPINVGGAIVKSAISMPKPAYPGKARSSRMSGTATMKLLVDEDGTVLSAGGVAGHPYFVEASAEAACKAKFSRAQRNGKPARAMGIVIYNFVP